jgi:hypothetical protein
LHIPEHLRTLAKRARAEGWEITHTGSGHLKWTAPRGQIVITGSTSHRKGFGPRMERRDLERAGLGAKEGSRDDR